mgnify:CR=1 FL=1
MDTNAVSYQVADSVTQVNTQVLGNSPAMALSNLYMATSQALSNAAHNATTLQMNTNVTAQAAMTQGVAKLFAIDTASTAVGTRMIFSS